MAWSCYTFLHLKPQILKLNDLYLYEVAKLMHKHARKKYP